MRKEVQREGKPKRDPDEVCLHTDVWSEKTPPPPSHPGLAASGQLLGLPLSLTPQGQAAGLVE